jgi:hypothetical protein
MIKAILAGLAASFLLPAPSMAQSGFDGTWKGDLATVKFSQKPDVYVLTTKVYKCLSCVPPVSVKADGAPHKVSGHPYYDSVAMKLVDGKTAHETDYKAGKIVTETTNTVSDDGKTLSFEFTDSSNSNAAPVTGKGSETRVAAGPKGAHAMSGSWKTAAFTGFSDNGLTVIYKVTGDSIAMSDLTGQSYTAKLDGTDAPMKGDPGITSVSVKKIGADTIEETDKRKGKVIAVATMKLAPGGKAMSVTYEDKLRGSTLIYTANKQ